MFAKPDLNCLADAACPHENSSKCAAWGQNPVATLMFAKPDLNCLADAACPHENSSKNPLATMMCARPEMAPWCFRRRMRENDAKTRRPKNAIRSPWSFRRQTRKTSQKRAKHHKRYQISLVLQTTNAVSNPYVR